MHDSVSEIMELFKNRPIPSVKPDIIWNESLDRKIAGVPLTTIFSDDDERKVYAIALQAAFFLLNDSLSKAHDVLQDPLIYDRNETGDYWHALMHRKEGDYENSKNWFPAVHPIHAELNHKVHEYLQNESSLTTAQHHGFKVSLQALCGQPAWDPSLFVNIVEKQVKKGLDHESSTILNNIQWFELELLLDFTCKNSIGCSIFELVAGNDNGKIFR